LSSCGIHANHESLSDSSGRLLFSIVEQIGKCSYGPDAEQTACTTVQLNTTASHERGRRTAAQSIH